MALFPEKMMAKQSQGGMTLETIASRLRYFEDQIQLIHWQTTSHAEHSALNLYDAVTDFRDDVMEKLMGYTGKRPKAYKYEPLVDTTTSTRVVTELKDFIYELGEWADSQGYCDIKNISDSLSGQAAKTLYLLTQS
jgi:hypothetical protein